MECSNSCRLFGGYQALAGIKDSVVLLHSVVGCNYAVLTQNFAGRMNEISSTCTVISDKDIINGGEESLEIAIEETIKRFSPKCLFVVTGCVSEIVADDIGAVVQKYKSKCEIHYFNGAGFISGFENGYNDALLQMAKEICIDTAKQPNIINIFGTRKDDYKLIEDISAIKRVLGDKIKINCVIGDCTFEEFQNIPNATLNITFGNDSIAKYLKEQYATPYEKLNYPIGILNSVDFLSAIEKHIDVDFTLEKQTMENYATARLEKIFLYLRNLYGMKVGVFADEARGEGLARFLSEELGMTVVLGLQERDDLNEFKLKCQNAKASVIFSSSFEKGVADSLNIPCFPYCYPVFSRISIGENPYVMGEGVVNFMNDLINMIMINKDVEDIGGVYSEKNMRLW